MSPQRDGLLVIAMHVAEGDGPADGVIRIENGRGPCVTALMAAGYWVSAISPMPVGRSGELGSFLQPGMAWCRPARGSPRPPETPGAGQG